MNLGLSGVKVDEDYKRYYPYGSLASKLLGFTGADNQGIIGLEVMYERYLKGRDGLILTTSDAKGTELQNAAEERVEPVPGNTLTVSLDVNIQKYAEQAAYQVMEKKGAKAVSVIVMNPRNGEIYAMVNVPEFDLNDPFTLNVESGGLTGRSSRTREIRCGGIAASMIPTTPAPHLRSSPPQQGWRREWSIWMTGSLPGASGSWRTGRSAAIRSVDMEERHFYREP